MDKLIEALQIFLKYKNVAYPFHCEHDILFVCGYDDIEFSEDDLRKLNELGFFRYLEDFDEDDDFNPKHENWDGTFRSYRYGSC